MSAPTHDTEIREESEESTDSTPPERLNVSMGDAAEQQLPPQRELESGQPKEPESAATRLRSQVSSEIHKLIDAVHDPALLVQYAKEGEYTTAKPGERSALRSINVGYAHCAKLMTYGMLITTFLIQRLATAAPAVLVVLMTATGVAQIPVVGLVVPDWLNIAAWLGW